MLINSVLSVRRIGGVCVFPLLGGLICICTLCILALLGLAIQLVGLILLLTWYQARFPPLPSAAEQRRRFLPNPAGLRIPPSRCSAPAIRPHRAAVVNPRCTLVRPCAQPRRPLARHRAPARRRSRGPARHRAALPRHRTAPAPSRAALRAGRLHLRARLVSRAVALLPLSSQLFLSPSPLFVRACIASRRSCASEPAGPPQLSVKKREARSLLHGVSWTSWPCSGPSVPCHFQWDQLE